MSLAILPPCIPGPYSANPAPPGVSTPIPVAATAAAPTARDELLKSLKEAEKITLENLPQAQQWRRWRTHFRRDVANASTRPKEAIQWINEVETLSFDELEDPKGFGTLDF